MTISWGQWPEGVVEDVIRDVAALSDALRFIEWPMDAEINSALAVFFFGLRERRKIARHVRAHIAAVVFCHTVEFIGDKHEWEAISAVESTEGLEKGTAEAGMA